MKKASGLTKRRIKQNIPLWIMFSPVLIFYIVFKYVPMGGLIIAFKQYFILDGIWNSPWIGLENFRNIFSNANSVKIIWNTFKIGFLRIFISFPFPILLAILLNEVRNVWLKKGIQTVLYLPHFFSWVVVSGIALTIFSIQTGVVNTIIKSLGFEAYPFMYKSGSWLAILIGSGIWKETGFNSIIYLAALTNVDAQLYEAASLDGANKFKQIIYVTLPSIAPTISIMLILAFGGVMSVGFELIYNFINDAVRMSAEVISTYIYTVGIQRAQFGVTTAMGFFESLVGFILVVMCNRFAKMFEQSLW